MMMGWMSKNCAMLSKNTHVQKLPLKMAQSITQPE